MRDQQIRFCRNASGIRIAYSVMGSGPPLVWVPGWVSHLEDDIAPSALWHDLIMDLSRSFTLVRFDRAGTGLSQRNISDHSVDARREDLEAVVAAACREPAFLFGVSEGGSIAISYAAAHPECVHKLVLYGAYARGKDVGTPETRAAFRALVAANWGLTASLLVSLFAPGANGEEADRLSEGQRRSADRDDVVALLESLENLDVTSCLPAIKAPTVVIHARRDAAVPYACGVAIAEAIPDATLITKAGHHQPDAAERRMLAHQLRAFFLGETTSESITPALLPEDDSLSVLSAREREVLALIVSGHTNARIAESLVIAESTAASHVHNILSRLGLANRAEAAAWGAQRGVGRGA